MWLTIIIYIFSNIVVQTNVFLVNKNLILVKIDVEIFKSVRWIIIFVLNELYFESVVKVLCVCDDYNMLKINTNEANIYK